MTIFLSEDYMPTAYRLDTHRPLPAGCSQQDRHPTRGHGTLQEPDTIVTDWGDDPGASRGLVEECTDFDRLADDDLTRMPEPSAGWVLLCGALCIAIVGACALVARALTT